MRPAWRAPCRQKRRQRRRRTLKFEGARMPLLLRVLRADRFLLSFSSFRPPPHCLSSTSSLSFFPLSLSPPPPHTHTRPPPPQITGPQKVQGRPRAFLPARPQAVDAPLGLLGTLAAAAALGARRRLGRGRTVRPLRDPAGPARRHARRRAPRLPRPVAPVPPGQEPGPCRRGLLRRVDHQGVQGAHRRRSARELREVRAPGRPAVLEDEHRAARVDVLEGREGGPGPAGAADRWRGAGAADAGW